MANAHTTAPAIPPFVDNQMSDVIQSLLSESSTAPHILIMRQMGTSMSPLIPAGTILIIDTSIRSVTKDGGLYLLKFPPFKDGGEPTYEVKYVFWKMDPKKYWVSSANKDYDSYEIDAFDLDIAGEVTSTIVCRAH